jgi:hypothetical protein
MVNKTGEPPPGPKTHRVFGVHLEHHDAQGGKRVESHPAEGGRSVSETDPDGSYRGELSGSLLRGKEGEAHTARILAAKMRALGRDVIEVPLGEAKDSRGEDRKFLIDGDPRVIQVVSMPIDEDLWSELRRSGTAERVGGFADTVQLVRASLEKKRNKAMGLILALDAAHVGALPSLALVNSYLIAHGDPIKEFGFSEVWIVGPTEASTFQVA